MIARNMTIVGLGLMGGSFARAIRPHVEHLTAVDREQETLRLAVREGVVDRGTSDLRSGLATAEFVVLAVPVRSIIHVIGDLARLKPEGCLVLDFGSTKREICLTMEALPASFEAIGGHPMCGRERSGWLEAEPDLYDNKQFVLCRTRRTGPKVEAGALSLISAVGAHPLFLPPDKHDQIVAAVSHVPYMISTTLMAEAAERARLYSELWTVSASGFRDTSRLAGSNPEMMLDILITNREALLAQLEDYGVALTQLATMLENGDEEELRRWLSMAHEEHEKYRREAADH